MSGLDGGRIVIVGAGAVGAACAYELARAGASVTVLERGSGWAWACSYGNAGLIVPSHAGPLAARQDLPSAARWLLRPDSPLSVRPRPAVVPWLARLVHSTLPAPARHCTEIVRSLAVESLEMFREYAAGGLDFDLRHDGMLQVYETERAFEHGREEAEASVAAGVPAEVLEPAQARAAEPSLRGVAGAVRYPAEAQCEPQRFVEAVGAAAVAAGADFRPRTDVLSLRDGRVETTHGRVEADAIVVAAGAWTPALVRELGPRLPVEAGKGYAIDMQRGPGIPRTPLILHESRVAVTPFADRLRLAGTLQLAGLDLSVDRRRVEAIEAAAQRLLVPEAFGERIEVWRGLRPCAPDGLPIIGRLPRRPDVLVATGHAQLGLTLAPVTGRLVTELLSGERRPELAALSPTRF